MAKPRLRICKCGAEQLTCSKSAICMDCFKALQKEKTKQQQHDKLVSIGYANPILVEKNNHGHNKWKVITPCCGTEYETVFGNVLKQLALIGSPPCGKCGGKERISKAMSGYVEKHGRTYDLQLLQQYAKKVRMLSEREYKTYRHFINPENVARGTKTGQFHLDHKVSIIWCFKNGVSPELAASKDNLQMLSVGENLKKGRKNISDEEALAILNKKSIAEQFLTELPEAKDAVQIVSDYANVWGTGGKIVIRESEITQRKGAVVSRILHHLRKNCIVKGARSLNVKSVNSELERQFLNDYHVQGYLKSKVALGLFDGSELLALMTFCTPRYKQKSAEWELLRFCVKAGHSAPGAANKLASSFIRTFNPSGIVSYSLNRWGDGKVYSTLGFTKTASNTSDFYLWKDDGKIRSWRASVLRAKSKSIKLTDECAVRIADPGSSTWLWRHEAPAA
jgi:hypothetical protein